ANAGWRTHFLHRLCPAAPAITLADHHTVVAIDINPVQVAYVQHRLSRREIQRGSAERILAFARSLAPLAGWNKRSVEAFLDLDDPKQQVLYWRRHLDARRFRDARFFRRFAIVQAEERGLRKSFPAS